MISSNDETAFLRWFGLDEMPALAIAYPDEALRGVGLAAHFEC